MADPTGLDVIYGQKPLCRPSGSTQHEGWRTTNILQTITSGKINLDKQNIRRFQQIRDLHASWALVREREQ